MSKCHIGYSHFCLSIMLYSISCFSLFFFVSLPVSLDYPFLIVPSVFSSVYLHPYLFIIMHNFYSLFFLIIDLNFNLDRISL